MRKWIAIGLVGVIIVCICCLMCARKLVPIIHKRNLGRRLINAAASGDIATARLLIQSGASVNYANSRMFDDTPLIWAVDMQDTNMVRFLVESGADVNKAEGHGKTPLMECTYAGSNAIGLAEYLLAHGASLDVKDHDGRTVFQYVEAQPRMADWLEFLKKEQNRRLGGQSTKTNVTQ
jgi:ankyrin repeat protein